MKLLWNKFAWNVILIIRWPILYARISALQRFWTFGCILIHSKLKGREGGGGESSSYIFIEKRMLFPIAWVWFSMNTYLRMYYVCYMTVDTCVIFLNRQPGHWLVYMGIRGRQPKAMSPCLLYSVRPLGQTLLSLFTLRWERMLDSHMLSVRKQVWIMKCFI